MESQIWRLKKWRPLHLANSKNSVWNNVDVYLDFIDHPQPVQWRKNALKPRRLREVKQRRSNFLRNGRGVIIYRNQHFAPLIAHSKSFMFVHIGIRIYIKIIKCREGFKGKETFLSKTHFLTFLVAPDQDRAIAISQI